MLLGDPKISQIAVAQCYFKRSHTIKERKCVNARSPVHIALQYALSLRFEAQAKRRESDLDYNVTHHVVLKVELTIKQQFHFSIKSLH